MFHSSGDRAFTNYFLIQCRLVCSQISDCCALSPKAGSAKQIADLIESDRSFREVNQAIAHSL
ncbi:MAG: hypothetical protein QNJ38_11230 [Prochloraceae cyanobacterium]|nr:hypothetical protein [Prochloraceae cyanobacterium]